MKVVKYSAVAGIIALAGAGCERNGATEQANETNQQAQNRPAFEQPSDDLQPGAGPAPDQRQEVAGRDPALRGETPTGDTPTGDKPTDARKAEADIKGAEGERIEGDAEFVEEAGGVRITVNVEDGLQGRKGIHIHQKGDCSDIKGKSMGDHFAPEGHPHALPSEANQQRHLGDLGNIEIGANGKGKLTMVLPRANLKPGDKMSLIGKSVVIHTSEDLGEDKQPSGGSGTPIACGTIEGD